MFPVRVKHLLNHSTKGAVSRILAPADADTELNAACCARFADLGQPECLHPGGLLPIRDPVISFACPSVFHRDTGWCRHPLTRLELAHAYNQPEHLVHLFSGSSIDHSALPFLGLTPTKVMFQCAVGVGLQGGKDAREAYKVWVWQLSYGPVSAQTPRGRQGETRGQECQQEHIAEGEPGGTAQPQGPPPPLLRHQPQSLLVRPAWLSRRTMRPSPNGCGMSPCS